MESAPRRGKTEFEGRTLAWQEVGTGPPLLLVNGHASTGADWDPAFLADLATTHRVICPDNRGLGGSEPGNEELTIEGMAADLEAVLDATGWSGRRSPLVDGRLRRPELGDALPERVASWL